MPQEGAQRLSWRCKSRLQDRESYSHNLGHRALVPCESPGADTVILYSNAAAEHARHLLPAGDKNDACINLTQPGDEPPPPGPSASHAGPSGDGDIDWLHEIDARVIPPFVCR